MSNSRVNKGVKNIIWGGASQLLVLLIGLVLPRLMMMSYGSEVNGLFNSVNQIFNYIALLEAGIGTATIQALYKPIVDNDRSEISSILVETRNYFRKVTFIYFAVVVAVSLIFPFITQSQIPKHEIVFVILLHGLSNVLTFWFTSTLRQLMVANGDSFLVNNVALITTALTAVGKIILASISANIILIQVSHLAINLIQILIYTVIFRKRYGWVNFKAEPRTGALKQRNSFVVHELSGVIFHSTPATLLSVFWPLAITSKYSTYNMIFAALNTLFTTLHNGLSFLLGYAYSEGREKYLPMHDAYATYFSSISFALISVCYFLILPFISLYTSGVEDLVYYDEKLPLLFCIVSLLSLSRKVDIALMNVSGHAKKTIPNTLIEAGINIVVSLILVKPLGISGVLIGSIVALLYRSNDMVLYSNLKILKRSPLKSYKIIGVNFLLFSLCVFVNTKLNIVVSNYIDFVIYGIIFSVILIPLYFIVNSIVNPKEFKMIWKMLRKKHS